MSHQTCQVSEIVCHAGGNGKGAARSLRAACLHGARRLWRLPVRPFPRRAVTRGGGPGRFAPQVQRTTARATVSASSMGGL